MVDALVDDELDKVVEGGGVRVAWWVVSPPLDSASLAWTLARRLATTLPAISRIAAFGDRPDPVGPD